MEFAPDEKMRAIPTLLEELSRYVLYDEEPLFVSDEATLLDLWSGDLLLAARLRQGYGPPSWLAQPKLETISTARLCALRFGGRTFA